ncbi:V-type ATPase subunit [Candidatus Peregrinibacteria bacterium]|nr:V-type ATPase subunit [Candidatus Peregrinibacteria bacterium]
MQDTRTDGHDIAYAHGRIAVLQQLLLSRSDVDRLLGAHDAREVAKIFIELRLTSRIDQGIADPDAVLTAVAHWVREEVLAMAPSKSLDAFDILWLEGDVPLLAYLLKQKLGLTSAISQEPAPAFTLYAPALWKELFSSTEHSLRSEQYPVSAKKVVSHVLALKDPTPASIDTIAAQWGANEQLRIAKRYGSDHILRYVRHTIDVKNIRTALRSIERPQEERKQLLVAGGTVPVRGFLGDRKDIAHAVEMADLGYDLAAEIRKEHVDIQRLEQSLSSVVAADIADMWNVPLSSEPLFAFATLAFTQITLLRTILLVKRAGFSPQETKRVLPPFLPGTHYVL